MQTAGKKMNETVVETNESFTTDRSLLPDEEVDEERKEDSGSEAAVGVDRRTALPGPLPLLAAAHAHRVSRLLPVVV